MVIRYGILDPKELSDWVLVTNKHYGNGIGGFGSRPVKPPLDWIRKLESRNQFYTRLEESILKEGIRNPIFCNSIAEGTFSRVGTSRLWIAKKHKIPVPCIIADYVDRWTELEELNGEDEIRAKFQDQPHIVDLTSPTKVGHVWIGGLPHYHLDETDEEYQARNDK